MKAKTAPYLESIQGKIGTLCGKMSYGKQCLTRLSLPFSKSKLDPTFEQGYIRGNYALCVDAWNRFSPLEKEQWTTVGLSDGITGLDALVRYDCTIARLRGATWTPAQRLGTETHVFSLAYLGGGRCLAGTHPTGQVYISTDYGATWTLAQRLGTETRVASLAYLGGGRCLAGTGATGQVYVSTDYGATWTLAQRLGMEAYVLSLVYLGGGRCLAGTYPQGAIFTSA